MKMFMRGEPLLSKLAKVAMYGVLPGALLAAVAYSPPDYEPFFLRPKDEKSPKQK